MANESEDRYRIYDETASLIAGLVIRKRISEEEMAFLLNLLDLVFFQNDQRDFIELLKNWHPGEGDGEIDEIIKATLLKTDLKNSRSIQENSEIIRDLIREKYR
jgi:hypothetical protein